MLKWCRVYKVTRHRAKVLTHDYAITLPDESASALYRGEVVSWCYGSAASWRRGVVVVWRPTTIVAARQRLYAREASWKLVFAREASWKAASCELEPQPKI